MIIKYLQFINDADMGEMSQEEVNKFIEDIKSELDLGVNESNKFDIDKFDKFIKRYKSSNYISKTGIKNLKNIGLEEHFFKVEKDTQKCLDFINNQDENLLREILIFALDNVPGLEYDRFESYISIQPEYPLNKSDIIIDTDVKNNIQNIIKIVNNMFNLEIQKKDDKNDKFFYKYRQSILKNTDLFKKLKIKPKLLLIFNYKNEIDYDYQEERKRYMNKSQLLQNSIKSEEVIERYLESIGYNDLKFSITYNFDYYYNNKVAISIIFDI